VPRWSVDFGNVLVQNISRENRGEIMELWLDMKDENDTARLDEFLFECSSTIPNAILGLKTLVRMNGPENVWMVSRASGIERLVNRRLFKVHRFAGLTGFTPEQIVFVDLFSEKAEVCRALGIAGHIDDRGEVHFHLRGVVPNLIWFSPSKTDMARWTEPLGESVVQVLGWNDLLLSF
ncbi:MAG: hypothetical protein UX72_C0025G0022, partial [Parcubacteria group bacterium GW2011_GWA2_47_10]